MSCSSAEARLAHRAACNFIPVLAALLLAWLSSGMSLSESHSGAPASGVPADAPMQPGAGPGWEAHAPRGVFAAPSQTGEARSYNPTLETSDSAGVLGFWMLASLCGLLLAAALTPVAVQKIRRQPRGH